MGSQVFTASGSWTAPSGVTSVTAECIGAGARGGSATSGKHGSGGGGGAYARNTAVAVTPGSTYNVTVGAIPAVGAVGGSSSFVGASVSVIAVGGSPGVTATTATAPTGGSGGSFGGSTGVSKYAGGQGATLAANAAYGGGGGGAGGPTGAGSAGGGTTGGAANTGGFANGVAYSGAGGTGGAANQTGGTAGGYGGGSGGAYSTGTSVVGGDSGGGIVVLTWTDPADTTAPSTPGTPAVTSSTSTSVTLAWTAATDNVGVTNYRVVTDGTIGSNLGNVLTTTISGLSATSHTFAVQALDAANNVSASSGTTTYTVVAPDTTAPTVPAVTVSASGTTVTVTWSGSTDAVGVTGYEVFRGGVSQGTPTSSPFTQTVTDGTYSYTVRARDAAGNWSAQSSTKSVTVDTTAPTVPTISTAIATGSSVVVTWNTNVDVYLYKIYRNGTQIGTTSSNTTTDTVPSDGTYTYTVSADDASGNWSAQSAGKLVTVDTTPPVAPVITALASARVVTISWTADADAASRQVFRNGTQITSTNNAASYTDTVTSDGTFVYTVKALDTAGNLSVVSNTVNVVVDTTPPTTPVPSATVVGGAVTVTWSYNADAALYEVFRGGTSQGTTTSTSFTQSPGDGTYSYTVRARDTANNWSAQSNAVSATVDTTPPAIPTLSVSATATSAVASWNSNSDVALYELFRDGTSQGTTTGTTLTQTLADGTYVYTIRAKDTTGNWSAQSTGTSVTIVSDTTPPNVPLISTVTNNGTAVTVVWNANTDVALYEVFRGGVSQGTLTGTAFTQTVAEGTYSYSVRARDAVGNWSVQTAGTSITVDTTPTATPVLPARETSHASNRATFSWVAVQDATLYEVFRNGTSVGTTSSTTFTDSGVAAGAYSYTIRTQDAASNWSDQSSPLLISVDAIGLHVPDHFENTVGQREFDGEDNIRFDRE